MEAARVYPACLIAVPLWLPGYLAARPRLTVIAGSLSSTLNSQPAEMSGDPYSKAVPTFTASPAVQMSQHDVCPVLEVLCHRDS